MRTPWLRVEPLQWMSFETGERAVPVSHLTDRFESLPSSTWAVRWERHEAWTQHPGYSQVRLQRTHDQLNWNELSTWVSNVNAMGHVAELCVIDDEFDATIYHLTTCLPTGDQNAHEFTGR